jgi:hypothetical protein
MYPRIPQISCRSDLLNSRVGVSETNVSVLLSACVVLSVDAGGGDVLGGRQNRSARC